MTHAHTHLHTHKVREIPSFSFVWFVPHEWCCSFQQENIMSLTCAVQLHSFCTMIGTSFASRTFSPIKYKRQHEALYCVCDCHWFIPFANPQIELHSHSRTRVAPWCHCVLGDNRSTYIPHYRCTCILICIYVLVSLVWNNSLFWQLTHTPNNTSLGGCDLVLFLLLGLMVEEMKRLAVTFDVLPRDKW